MTGAEAVGFEHGELGDFAGLVAVLLRLGELGPQIFEVVIQLAFPIQGLVQSLA